MWNIGSRLSQKMLLFLRYSKGSQHSYFLSNYTKIYLKKGKMTIFMGIKYMILQLPSWETPYFLKGMICQPRRILKISLNFRIFQPIHCCHYWIQTDVDKDLIQTKNNNENQTKIRLIWTFFTRNSDQQRLTHLMLLRLH